MEDYNYYGEEPKKGFNFFSYFKAFAICLIVGLVIVFEKGSLNPYWSIIPFAFALAILIFIIVGLARPEKFEDPDC